MDVKPQDEAPQDEAFPAAYAAMHNQALSALTDEQIQAVMRYLHENPSDSLMCAIAMVRRNER